MKISKSRKWIALLLSALLLIPSFASAASSSSDIKGHWAENSLVEWVDQGLLEGFTANVYKPNKDVTRAEFMTFINRAFGLSGTTTLNYKDVHSSTNKWYVKEVGKAVQAGYVKGYSDNTIRPNDSITRQEAAVMLANLVKGTNASSADLSRFSDAAKIASWAEDSIAKIFGLGYIAGYPNNTLKPQNEITRAESVVMINRAMEDHFTIYKKAGTYGAETGQVTVAGDVMITVANVTLKNTIVEGNLILGKGIGEGDVTLNNVTVKGDTIVQGGGVNSIYIINSSLYTIIVDKATGVVRIIASGTTVVDSVNVKSPAIFVENNLTGAGFGNITVTEQANGHIELSGNFDKVIVDVTGVTVNVVSGSVQTLEVTTEATDTTINLAANTTVTNLNLKAATDVTGTGTVVNANVTASGVSFDHKPTNLIVKDGIIVIIRPTPTPTVTPIPSAPTTPVVPSPSTAINVSTEAELLAALANSYYTHINVTEDIAATKTVVINRAVVLNGNDKSISLTGEWIGDSPAEKHGVVITSNYVTIINLAVTLDQNNAAWGGNYGIQVYDATNVTLNSVTVSGADAGILVNASKVVLTGTTNVSDNEFGGIEVSKGSAEGLENSELTLSGTIVNESETELLPTIWVDHDNDSDEQPAQGTFNNTSTRKLIESTTTKDNGDVQTFYHLNVYNEEQLLEAIADETMTTIALGKDIDATATILIDREVVLNGNEKKISFASALTSEVPAEKHGLLIQSDAVTINDLRVILSNDEDGWKSNYGIQVYDATGVTLNNVAVSGADGGILVNASAVTLTGTTDVSGNEFGGIEVSKGTAEGLINSELTVGIDATILNTTETASKPTIWLENGEGTVVGWNSQLIEVAAPVKPQTFYLLNVYNEVQLRAAVADESMTTISLGADISGLVSSLEIKRSDVTLDGNGYKLSFESLLDNDKPLTSGILIEANGVNITDIYLYSADAPTPWKGSYGIQIYNATGVTLNNVTIENFNAATLVNASEVELTGVMELDGQGFGGIEVSKGEGTTRNSLLTLTGTIVNSADSATTPTVWVVYDADGSTPQGTFTHNESDSEFTSEEKKDEDDKITQVYYHLTSLPE